MRECTLAALNSCLGTVHLDKMFSKSSLISSTAAKEMCHALHYSSVVQPRVYVQPGHDLYISGACSGGCESLRMEIATLKHT
ncbi:unnamed protein product [Arabidopsis thaliana]|uniref:(thale cress) hypothetical protein n=1 Tax=Arabidopsis thaliana TaxID=3702 RepID=A0A7G2EQ96_ARATH|nr:unnamed protein product [Arabidopsis thaliana]